MEAGLAANSNTMTDHFDENFRWMGNQGCGTKPNLQAFRDNWQLPIRAAFTERDYKTEHFMADGEWAACFGHIEATHSGTFMGIEATGKRVKIPYMDFWKIADGRIQDNWVSVDFPAILAELGHDVFDGKGWENYDNGTLTPPKPE
ncbi:MAG: ester cyclase [Pseudomonadota bacterium]